MNDPYQKPTPIPEPYRRKVTIRIVDQHTNQTLEITHELSRDYDQRQEIRDMQAKLGLMLDRLI